MSTKALLAMAIPAVIMGILIGLTRQEDKKYSYKV